MSMSTVMSRYSVLNIEDSDEEGFVEVTKKGKPSNNLTPTKTQSQAAKKKKNQKKKKAEAKAEADELKAIAFGGGKNKAKPHRLIANGTRSQTPEDKNQNSASENPGNGNLQYEEWKKRDEEFVEGEFENELHQALLLSKLDYEKKKEFYDSVSASVQHQETKPNKKSKKKNNTVSLAEFNNMEAAQVEKLVEPAPAEERLSPPSASPKKPNDHFFTKHEEDVQKQLEREHYLNSFKGAEGRSRFLADQAKSLQMEELLSKKDEENERLRSENVRLSEELNKVKKRNKKLCTIFGQSEVRDKAELLVQVEKLTEVTDELTEKVSDLHQQLEQERSKVSQLNLQLNKLQNRKRTVSDAAQ